MPIKLSPHPIPDEALDQDIAILGKKGRGKTFTAKGVVERLLQMQRRVVVLDPLSVWWGLKASADGKSEGFPIPVFGGPHGDIPLHDGAGRVIGELIVSSGTSAVLDLGQMRRAEQARLVADLLDYLFTHNRDPLWLVLEEADAFAPQQPMGDLARVLGEVDRIARRGRNFGFRLISITQRPAKLHKDVLTQLSTLVALGVTSPQDRDALKAWVEGNADRAQAKEVYDSLASLPVGEGWVWVPDHDLLKRVRFPRIATLDTSATPKAGEKRISAPVLAKADIEKIAQQIRAIQTVQSSPRLPQRAEEDLTPTTTATDRPRLSEAQLAALGKVVRAARKEANLTQVELARRCGTTQQAIGRLEGGGSAPTTTTLQRIAEATGRRLVIRLEKPAAARPRARVAS
jgi:DNA-binding XRE family transcriptional regulator